MEENKIEDNNNDKDNPTISETSNKHNFWFFSL